MSYKIKLVDAITVPRADNRKNEDSFFFADQAAFVFDGATGLGPPIVTKDSDANWFVSALQFQLQYTSAGQLDADLKSLLQAALKGIACELGVSANELGVPHLLPSAGGVGLKLRAGRAEIFRAGDCKIYRLRGQEHVELFPPSRLEVLDQVSIEKLIAQLKDGFSPEEARTRIMPTLQEHRALMNTSEGYGVLTPDPQSIEFVNFLSEEIWGGDEFLLATDGFYTIFTEMGVMTFSETVEAMRARCSSDVVKRLRAAEYDDPGLQKYPRLKHHDDATALLIRAVEVAD